MERSWWWMWQRSRLAPILPRCWAGPWSTWLRIALGQQAALPTDQRRHVALLVDEFHALPAANYEAFLAELAKYGASLVLATQSLGALDTVDPQRGLRNTVFANVDHLFAIQLLGRRRARAGAGAGRTD